jgi:hypothetical protein
MQASGLAAQKIKRETYLRKMAPLIPETASLKELSARTGYSESIPRRWKSGAREIPLSAALALLDVDGRLGSPQGGELGRSQLASWIAKENPLALLPLFLLARSGKTGLRLEDLSGASDISPSSMAKLCKLFERFGLIFRGDNGFYRPVAPLRDCLDQLSYDRLPDLFALKRFWYDRNADAFLKEAPSTNAFQGLFVRPCSVEQAALIRRELRQLSWRISQIVDEPLVGVPESISMFSLQIVDPLS